MNTDEILDLISNPDLLPQRQRHYGIFYGVVEDNIDPLLLGRLRVRTPHYINVDMEMIPWATYSSPGGGGSDNVGFYFIPVVGSVVTISFVGGNLEFPVWLGGVPGAPDQLAETFVSKMNETAPYGVSTTGWDYTQFNSITTPSGHRIILDDNSPIDDITAQRINQRRVSIESSAGHYFRIIESKNLLPGVDNPLIELATVDDEGSDVRRIALDNDLEVITVTAPDSINSGSWHSIEINTPLEFMRVQTAKGYTLLLDDTNRRIDLLTKHDALSEDGHRIRLDNPFKQIEIKTIDDGFCFVSHDIPSGYAGIFGPYQSRPAGGYAPESRRASVAVVRDVAGYSSIMAAGDGVLGSNGVICHPGYVGVVPQSVTIYGSGVPTIGVPYNYEHMIRVVTDSKGTASPVGEIYLGDKLGTNTIVLDPSIGRIRVSAFALAEVTSNIDAIIHGGLLVRVSSDLMAEVSAPSQITLSSASIIMSGPVIHDYFQHVHDIDLTTQTGLWIIYDPQSGAPIPVQEAAPGIHVQTLTPR